MNFLLISWGLLLGGALVAPLMGRGKRFAVTAGCGSAIIGCAFGLVAAVKGLFAEMPLTFFLPWSMPGGAFSLNLDAIACFFLLPLFFIGLIGAIYGAEYMGTSKSRLPGHHWFFYNLLIISMSLVVTAANGLLFLFAWECMSLSSFLLVGGDHEQREVRRAGLIYLVATHLGAAFLFVFFLYAGAVSGSLEFASFHTLRNVSPPIASMLFVALLVGFGSKAGVFPFHVWLPEAHPAAPSHVSALMSGVMVKIAIYGIFRFLSFLPAAPGWWGGLMMAAGITGALFGIGMAAIQTDMKRSLAYSTVENIGIIFLALGFWLYSVSVEHHLAAALALTGGLLHIWNHALFKTLLFMGAGSILHGTGTRNLDRMGGLLRRMPYTGLAIICGSMAVAALPPLNGLVGEWFIYRALLESGYQLQGLIAFFPLVFLGLLALIGGMALIVFSRLAGISLSGEPRHQAAVTAHESGWPMLGAMGVLAMLCLAGGLMPALLLEPVGRTARIIDPGTVGLLFMDIKASLWLGRTGGGLLVLVGIIYGLSRWLQSRRRVEAASTWGCGFKFPASRMSYSAEGYVELAQNNLFCNCLRSMISGGRAVKFFPDPARFFHDSPDIVLKRIFLPFFSDIASACTRLRLLQAGSLHIYMMYIFTATTLLLCWVAFQ